MIFSPSVYSDPAVEAKIIYLSAYLFFYALPFALSYFQIWFFYHLSLLLQKKQPDAPRWIRFSFFALPAAFCVFGIFLAFFSTFPTAAEFLHIYLIL